jgi:hypothetical protein
MIWRRLAPRPGKEPDMQVTAFSTPARPDWRWRIVNYAGEIIAESREEFPTIAAAIARGTARLTRMHIVDQSAEPPRGWTNAHRPRK